MELQARLGYLKTGVHFIFTIENCSIIVSSQRAENSLAFSLHVRFLPLHILQTPHLNFSF
jgi:hypothetical protein